MSDPLLKRTCTFNDDRTLRWTLEVEWHARLPKVCFIGHNPSTADEEITDQTVGRWITFGRAWGYGGIIAVNAYPFRDVSPPGCRAWLKTPDAGAQVAFNLSVIAQKARDAGLIVACWGAILRDLTHAEAIPAAIAAELRRYVRAPRPIHCFGITASGAPIHLAARGKHSIRKDAQPQIWRQA